MLPKDSGDAPETGDCSFLDNLSLSACAHVAKIGWQTPVTQFSSIIGTTGRGLAMEAVSLSLGSHTDLGISYRVLMKGQDWSAASENGANAGTTGQAIPLQAIRIALTGDLADSFDIYYQAHVSSFGWLDWAKNDEIAGVVDLDYSLEAIRITLVKKGSAAPDATTIPKLTAATVSYRSYLQQSGWQNPVKNGQTSGSTGQAKALHAFTASVTGMNNLALEYSVCLSSDGWQNYIAQGAMAGVTDESRQIEAFRIRLTGAGSAYYNVWYRVHSAKIGWLDWAMNGASAGTQSYGYAAEAIEIVILPKGMAAPGKTTTPFLTESSAAAKYATEILSQVGWNLNAAFRWSSTAIRYTSISAPPAGTSHAEWYGTYGFQNRTGNCYVMASTFYWMAKQLGYKVYLVEGQVPLRSGGLGPHSWCEIEMDGTTYVFDPDFTYETGKNGFQITYGTSGTWRYSNYQRVN